MASQTHPPSGSSTVQCLVLAAVQDESSGSVFIPCVDRSSKAAFRSSLSGLLAGGMLWGDIWFLKLVLLPLVLPLYVAYWFWRRRRPQPGWLIDWDHRRVQAVRQKHNNNNNNNNCPLTPEMGLLAHHRQIDITHPTRGPVLTLFTAAPSRDPQDQLAQEALAQALAERLSLRLVGCRVQLDSTHSAFS